MLHGLLSVLFLALISCGNLCKYLNLLWLLHLFPIMPHYKENDDCAQCCLVERGSENWRRNHIFCFIAFRVI
jgi:hypothetical protein